MLTIEVPKTRLFRPADNSFIYVEPETLQMEHSLLSISKWESKWHIPFMDKRPNAQPLAGDRLLSYLECMTIGKARDPMVYAAIMTRKDLIAQISAYIEDPMTATDNHSVKSRGGSLITTSEEIYHLMFKCRIPKECEKWHVNRLMTLITVFGEKENPKKMSKRDILASNESARQARRAMNAGKPKSFRRP